VVSPEVTQTRPLPASGTALEPEQRTAYRARLRCSAAVVAAAAARRKSPSRLSGGGGGGGGPRGARRGVAAQSQPPHAHPRRASAHRGAKRQAHARVASCKSVAKAGICLPRWLGLIGAPWLGEMAFSCGCSSRMPATRHRTCPSPHRRLLLCFSVVMS
jgi:hypothetical protein